MLLFIASPLPIAFPPTVRAVINIPINILIIVALIPEKIKTTLFNISPPMDPLNIPQTSPITSLQKLETFSAFLIKLIATFAPFNFLMPWHEKVLHQQQ